MHITSIIIIIIIIIASYVMESSGRESIGISRCQPI